jgi:hypothetical protein
MLTATERVSVHIQEDRARIQAVVDKDPAAPTDAGRGKP